MLSNALGFGSLAYTGWLRCEGDGGASAEAGAELLALNALATGVDGARRAPAPVPPGASARRRPASADC